MSRELEERLERALSQVEPGDATTQQARAAALDALPHGLRARHRAALLIAAALGVLALTAGTLAASETAREVVGISAEKSTPPPQVTRGPLPDGASGFATVVGDRVWLAHQNSKRIQTGRFSAFELSPNAIYAVAGRRGALLALNPSGFEVVKRHRVNGTVTAISWAPIGIYIAYVVQRGADSELHLIEGNFTNDRVVARSVAGITPSWRWDSLAFAYATTHGAVRVVDLGKGRTIRLRAPHCASESGTRQLGFAPSGSQLAVGGVTGVAAWIADTTGRHPAFCVGPDAGYTLGLAVGAGFAWISPQELALTVYQFITRVRIGDGTGTTLQTIEAPGGTAAIAASHDRRSLALALRSGRVIVVDAPGRDERNGGGPKPARVRQVLLEPPQIASPLRVALLWR
jgi:hypothetical protein